MALDRAPTDGPSGGVADSLDEAKAALWTGVGAAPNPAAALHHSIISGGDSDILGSAIAK